MGTLMQPERLAESRLGRYWRTSLQLARFRLGLTLKQAAQEFHITPRFLNMLEHGSRDPSLRLARLISARYGKTIDELWTEQLA